MSTMTPLAQFIIDHFPKDAKSKKALRASVGVTRMTTNRWRRGLTIPSATDLDAFCDFTGAPKRRAQALRHKAQAARESRRRDAQSAPSSA